MIDVECQFVCRSHKLTMDSLGWLNRDSTQISITLLDDHRFVVRSKISETFTSSPVEAAYKAHRFLLVWLVSLNVGSLAHFDFAEKNFASDIFKVEAQKIYWRGILQVRQNIAYPNSDRYLEPEAIRRAGLVFIALAQERDESIVNEYVKGLFHFGAHFFGIDFWKDAFSNFYRSFEHFITRRILKTTKLRNEVKDICIALEQVGVPIEIQKIFSSEIYPLRSAQVMHAWQEQKRIDIEAVGKIKLLCDVTMFKAYEPEWTATIESA